ncbi:MAG TPA: hypothetical protein PKH94_01390 [Bacteroidales bacterium]|nr:hypothetical protein [Bacteroidales bacterium]HNS45870.1 hypothetical protein [Bacteroidales bacterium]
MNARLSLFLMGFIAIATAASAQDILYKTDGSKEEVKILQVGNREIQYKKFDNPDGPVYVINKENTVMITYEDGDYDLFSRSDNLKNYDNQELATDFALNVFAYHLFDLIFGDFALSYERLLPSGTLGIKIPVAFGFDEYDDWNFNNIFYSGVGVNFYPTGQGKWKYFMGPQLRIGYSKATDWVDYWDDDGNYWYSAEVISEGIYSKFFIDNGIQFMPLKSFSVSAIGSIGIRYFPEAPWEEDVVRTDGQFAINLSYRF